MKSHIVIATLLTVSASCVWAATETREVDEFEKVSFELPFNVEFVASDEPYVSFEGDADTIDEIITEVKGDTLKIHKDNKWFDWSDDEIHVTVGFENLSAIRMAGSGDGFAQDLQSDKMHLDIAGSAGLEIESLTCNDLEISIAGSGNINLNNLEADSMSTRIAGAGDVEVNGSVVSQNI
jgi:hypothetical protein